MAHRAAGRVDRRLVFPFVRPGRSLAGAQSLWRRAGGVPDRPRRRRVRLSFRAAPRVPGRKCARRRGASPRCGAIPTCLSTCASPPPRAPALRAVRTTAVRADAWRPSSLPGCRSTGLIPSASRGTAKPCSTRSRLGRRRPPGPGTRSRCAFTPGRAGPYVRFGERSWHPDLAGRGRPVGGDRAGPAGRIHRAARPASAPDDRHRDRRGPGPAPRRSQTGRVGGSAHRLRIERGTRRLPWHPVGRAGRRGADAARADPLGGCFRRRGGDIRPRRQCRAGAKSHRSARRRGSPRPGVVAASR